MKSSTSRLSSLLTREKEQPVRVIKAAQAGKLLSSGGNGNGHAAPHEGGTGQHKPEIRLVQAGSDFCDLEVVCGCGESTRVRCWNSPTAEAGAAKVG